MTITFPGPLHVGEGEAGHWQYHARTLGMSRPLLVTGALLRESAMFAHLFGDPPDGPCRVTDSHEPTFGGAVAGADQYRDEGCDGIVAFGGGGRLDLAKVIRALVQYDADDLLARFFDEGGVVPMPKTQIPLLCLPTTAGSGSEVSRGAVIYDQTTGRKRLLAGPGMVATASILDPLVLKAMPVTLRDMRRAAVDR